MDVVVRRALLLVDLGRLVEQAHLHQVGVGVLHLQGVLSVQGPDALHLPEAFQGVGLRQVVLQGEDPGEIHDETHGALDVQGVLVLSLGLQHEVAEEVQGRLEVEGVFCEMAEEALPSPQGAEEVLAQLAHELAVSVAATEVEEDARLQEVFRFRLPDPAAEIRLPRRERLAPVRVAGHDVEVAVAEADLVEPIGDELSQLEEEALGLLQLGLGHVLEDNGVVLVRFQGLFPAALAAQEHEGEPDRGRACFL